MTWLGNGVASDWLVFAWQVPRINGCRPSGNTLPMIVLGTSSESIRPVVDILRKNHPRTHHSMLVTH